MIRRIFLLPAFVSLCCIATHAQRPSQQQQPTSQTELTVYVSYDDDNTVPQMCRVQLQTGSRMPVADSFANDRGQVTFHVGQGSYRIVAILNGREVGDVSFAVNPRENVHQEYIRFKHQPAEGAGNSTEGSVSAAALNIPDKAKKEFDKGVSASEKQDLDGASRHFGKAIEIYPQYSMALVNLGVISIKQGHVDDGQALFERAIKADPQLPNGYTNLARLCILQANYPEAETLLAKALTIRPLDPEPLTMLATSQMRSGEYDQAIVTSKKAHSVPHERYAVIHIVAAEAFMQLHQPDRAADEYRLFLKEFPASPNADEVRATLHSLEDHSDAGARNLR